MMPTRLAPLVTFFAFVACGGATAIVPDDGSGATSGNGGATGSGSVTGGGGQPTGGVIGAGGKATGGVSGTRWAKEYHQECNFDEDCVAVTEGPVCTCNQCSNAAISVKVYERWLSASGPCGPIPCNPVGCQEMAPACYDGTCGVRPVDYIQPGSFDRACLGQNDCTLVRVGDPCSGCNCEFDAVNFRGLEQYNQRTLNTSCGSPGVACDCVIPSTLCGWDGSSTVCLPMY